MEQRYSKASLVTLLFIMSGLFFLCSPGPLKAQAVYQVPASPPPIEAQFIRQGDFAAALAYRLGVTDGQNEARAEGELAALGIVPRNGWISDDPVTPDIVGDLEVATAHAADARLIPLPRDEALGRFMRVVEESGIAISPGAGAAGYASSGSMIYPDQPDITDYYVSEGPPVITYYEPPLAYYSLYSWVPYPFWYGGSAYAGYYILRDHHRHGHDRRHVSNHGRDGSPHHQPADQGYRFNGRPQGHNNNRAFGPSQRTQKRPRSMVGSASFPRNRVPEALRPVTPTIPTLSGRTERGVREVYPNPPVARPSMGPGARFSSPRTFHPSPPTAGSAGIRQGSTFGGSSRPATGSAGIRHEGPVGESYRPPAAGGWSRGSSEHGFGGRGYSAFRR